MTDVVPLLADDEAIPRRPTDLVELPLSPFQERWWFFHTRYPGATSPLVWLVHRLRGPLVVDAWVRAVSALVDRHETLRTLFVDRPEGPVQVVGPPRGLAVEQLDLRDVPESEREERARELLNERRQVVLDLERGPLVASCLLRLAADDYVWTLTIHHILADGASLPIIDRELGALYRAYVGGTEPDLPELEVQYGDFAVWCAAAHEPQYDIERRYWLDRLAGVPALELRTDLPRPASKGAPAAEVRHTVGADLVARVDELAKGERCTRFMALLAALQVLLARNSGQPDFCVGVPVVGSGRTRAELAPLVGLFNNVLALRCDLSTDPSFRALLVTTRETVIDALDHQDIPFGRIATALDLPPDPSRAQVFQAMFLLDELHAGGPDLPGLTVTEFPLAIPKILHDLMVFAWLGPQGLVTRFVYDSALFAEATMIRLAGEYEQLLCAAVAGPDARLSELAVDGGRSRLTPAG